MGTLRTADAHAALERSIQAGNLIDIPQESWQVGRAFTTPEMKKMEVEVLVSMLRGRNQHGSIASEKVQDEAIRNSQKHLNDNQVAAVRDVLSCQDCQGQSKTRPPGRSKSRPVDSLEVVGFAG
jgi:hypothetical protein